MSITITLPHISTVTNTFRTITESTRAIVSSRSFKIAKKAAIVGVSAYIVYTCYTRAKAIHDEVLLQREEAKRARELDETRRREQEKKAKILSLWKKVESHARVVGREHREKKAQCFLSGLEFFRQEQNRKKKMRQDAFDSAVQSAKAHSAPNTIFGRLYISCRQQTEICISDICKREIELFWRSEQRQEAEHKKKVLRFHTLRNHCRRVRFIRHARALVSHAQATEEVLEASTSYACIRTILLISKEKGSFSMDKVREVKMACRNHSICLSLIKLKQEEKWFRPFKGKALAKAMVAKEPSAPIKTQKQSKNQEDAQASSSTLQIPATAPIGTISTVSPLTFLKPELVAKKYSLPSDWNTSGAFVVCEEEAVIDILIREYKYYRTNQIAHPGAREHHPGVKQLDKVQYLELQSELAVLRDHKVVPYQFMAQPGWSGERRENVQRQIEYVRMRAKLQAAGKWIEPTPEEKAAKAKEIPALMRNQPKRKSPPSYNKGSVVVQPPVQPKTTEKEIVAETIPLPRSPPPRIDPLPEVTPFVQIQEEQLVGASTSKKGKVTINVTDDKRGSN